MTAQHYLRDLVIKPGIVCVEGLREFNMVEALVKPELLVWGRSSANFSIEAVAKKMQLKPERITAWESGSTRPTFKQLLKLAQIYKRPVAVFYLAAPPQGFSTLQDFRKTPGGFTGENTPELNYEIRKANFRRETALQLLEDLQGGLEAAHKLSIATTLREQPVDFAARLRDYLGVSLAEQFAFDPHDGGYGALNRWKEAVESKGVLVFQTTGVEVKEMRGFSISAPIFPVIALNNKDAPLARVFTLIHELAHLALGAAGICNFHGDAIEVYCNAVAGELLVPRGSFTSEALVLRNTQGAGVPSWSDSTIVSLANKYSVSRQVLLRRIQTLSLISANEYRAKQLAYEKQAELLAAKKGPGGPSPSVKAVSSAGSVFTRLVLAGYYQEKLTGSDVSEFLNVKLKHLTRIEEMVSS